MSHEVLRGFEVDALSAQVGTVGMLQISVEGGEIRLTKFQPACLFCGESLEVIDFRGKRVCSGCIRKLEKSLEANKHRPVRGRR